MRLCALVLSLLFAVSAFAAPDAVKIVAVVNDQIISSLDLEERMALIMATTGIPDVEENRTRLAPQVLRQLIDEKLQMQEATANSINISDAKVQEAIRRIEQQNNKPAGSFEAFLDSKHVSRQSFDAQVRAQVAWSEIVIRKIRPKIRVSDQEMERYVRRKTVTANADGHSREVMIAAILLPVDSPQNAPSVQKAADKLADEIHSGRSFEAIAAQFSSGSGSKTTPPFWVELSQLDPAISAALEKIAKGGVTEPVKTGSGYQLIKLVDSRQGGTEASRENSASEPAPRSEFAFRQVILTAKGKGTPEALLEQAKQVAQSPGQCTDKVVPPQKGLEHFDADVSFIRRTSDTLPEKVRDILYGLKVGNASAPVATGKDIRIFMLCERMDLPPEKQPSPAAAATASDEAARQAIYEEKLELEVQKYLRNLRREAFIEIHGM
jgi:peptidyl-prolyl cis-trans isomerase SurA